MFGTAEIEYSTAGVMNNLVMDYLSRDKNLAEYYENFPDEKGFNELLSKNPYRQLQRAVLKNAAFTQSQLTDNCSAASRENIERLADSNCYTITTGHQLCLFTGPSYFIYKILSAIRLARHLGTLYPQHSFVPVYWMASEDHDFAEVNHFNVFGKKIEWEQSAGGAVGDLSTAGLRAVAESFREIAGAGKYAERLNGLFEQAYLRHSTLADATRFLVNELFGEWGIVVLDGNDRELKLLFREELRADLFSQTPFREVSETIEMLQEKGYRAQVNPREINCFFLEKNVRTRIEKEGDGFRLTGSERRFSAAEMERIIDGSPELLSPNVTLRPVYQQKILPNLAYVGGPGELAYWLEYKKMFSRLGVQFPILVPRNFITIVDVAAQKKMNKLGFSAEDFFRSEQDLVQELQKRSGSLFELEEERAGITSIYDTIAEKLKAVDKTLEGALAAELQKTLKGLEHISAKANRSMKQKMETEINQIAAVRQKLFPLGLPQERHENFSSFYLQFGDEFFEAILERLQPMPSRALILSEERA